MKELLPLPHNVTIRKLSPEPGEPEKNSFDKLKWLMEQAGLITKQRQPVPDEKMKEWVGKYDVEGKRPIRPMAEAEPRARLYKEVKKIRKMFQTIRRNLLVERKIVAQQYYGDAKEDVEAAYDRTLQNLRRQEHDVAMPFLDEGSARQEVLHEYLKQEEVTVPLDNGETLMARAVVVHPPETKRTPETDALPPIFLIPGISNDIGSAGNLVRELALSGRTVAVIGFPESHLGGVAPSGIEHHTEFFKKAMDALRSYHKDKFGDKPIELWGVSTGAIYAAELLNSPEVVLSVKDAVLASPAGVVDQSVPKMLIGGMIDYAFTFLRPSTTARSMWTETTRFQREDPKLKQEKKNITEKKLMKFVTQARIPWQKAHVSTGGHIYVVAGDMDYVTQAKKVFNLQNEDKLRQTNDQIRVVQVPRGLHGSPYAESDRIIPMIREKQTYWS